MAKLPAPADFISFNTAAEMADLHPRTIRRMVAEGKLPGYQISPRAWRVKRSELLSFIESTSTMRGASA